MNDWLGLAGKTVLVTGFKNKKSVAWHIGKKLLEAGAHVIWTVRAPERQAELTKLAPQSRVYLCDVEQQASIDALAHSLHAEQVVLHGLVHSIAFAHYRPMEDGSPRPFHATARQDFLQAIDISCFSLMALAQALQARLADQASVITISISTTRMASENYGYMAPIKAALDAAVVFLAKSFAARGIRFNALCPGLLKTSASAGIPGYLESYLFAEQATLRKKALATEEVGDTALFLLSPRSSGLNAQSVVLDAGMSVNYFDRDLVRRAVRPDPA